MKSIAIFVAASLLLEMLAPTLAHATRHLQGTQVEGDTRAETAEKAEEMAERVIQWLYEKDVRVMSRGEIDPSKLRKGWYAHVVYTSEGVEETATGKILDKDADGIVIQPRGRNWEREIAYGDIDTLVVAQAPRDIERWRRLTEGGLIVMSRGELDLSKLRKGWHAHVVYTLKGVQRTATGKVLDKDADGIVIRKSRYRPWERWEIAYGDIDTLVVAKAQRDIEGWRRWFGEKGLRSRLVGGELDLSRLSALLPLLEGQRIRIHTRDTEKRIAGRFHQATKDTLILMKWRGILKQKKQFVPIAATNISKFEVHRYYKSYVEHGAFVGAFAGLLIYLCLIASQPLIASESGGAVLIILAPAFTCMGSFCGVVVGAVFSHDVWDVIDLPPSSLRGTQTKSGRWVKVPPQRVNLSISPTPIRGLRAALSFNF